MAITALTKTISTIRRTQSGGSRGVDVTLHLTKYKESAADRQPTLHPRYIIGKVNVMPGDSTGLHLRRGVIADNTLIEPGKYFSATDLQNTYNNFARLGTIRFTDIEFREMPQFDSVTIGKIFDYTPVSLRFLETNIKLSHTKPNTFSFQPEVRTLQETLVQRLFLLIRTAIYSTEANCLAWNCVLLSRLLRA